MCNDGKVRWVKLVDNGDGTYSETLSAVTDDLSSTDLTTPSICVTDNGKYVAYTTSTAIKVISLEGTETLFSQSITNGAESMTMSTKETGKYVIAAIADANLQVYTFDPTASPQFVLVSDLSSDLPFTVASTTKIHASFDGTLISAIEGAEVYLGVTSLGSSTMDIYWSEAYTLSDQAIFKIRDDFGEYYVLPELRSQAQLADCSND